MSRTTRKSLEKVLKAIQHTWPMVIVLLAGLAARLVFAAQGHNYDFDSYLLVLDLLERGQNVYANTPRYNYGPVWFNLTEIIHALSVKNQEIFRFGLVVFLSMVDVGIFVVMWKRFGRIAAGLFFLNPISIIVTGYHSQFDNLAVLLGMISVEWLDDDFREMFTWRKLLAGLMLGFSLMTKHILFVFPLWLAIKQKGILQKMIVFGLPVTVFVLGFSPYWIEGARGIIQNVWLYQSSQNEYLYRLLIPQILQSVISAKFVWVILLIGFAFYFKERNGFESLLLYTSILVWASPSIANQYLAIPVAYSAAFFNPFHLAYTVVGTWHLLVDYDGLQIAALQPYANRDVYYLAAVILLFLGFIQGTWGHKVRRGRMFRIQREK